MKSYRKRILLPVEAGSEEVKLYSKDGFLLSIGYLRVVIGKRGPYVEFDKRHIQWNAFYMPTELEYRKESNVVFYEEYRSKDDSYTMLYLQKKTVAYADYKIGLLYVSPLDLYFYTNQRVITDK